MEPKKLIVVVFLVFFSVLDGTEASIPKYFIEEHCDQMLNLNYGGVEVVRLHLTKDERYPDGMRCRMIIQAPEGKRLMMAIEELDLDANKVFQNNQITDPSAQIATQECGNGDYALFMDGPDENALPLLGLSGRVCQRPEQKSFLSSGRYISLFFMSNTNMVSGKGMKLLFTAFSDGPCQDGQFQCADNDICIKKSLECDGFSNCMDRSDEAMPKCLSTGAIAGIAVGGTIMIILIIVIVVICWTAYQRRKRARIIKRAIVRGDYPCVTWDGKDTKVIFDPITEEHLRRYSAIDAYGPEQDVYKIEIKDGVLVETYNLQASKQCSSATDEQKVKANGENMVKYPSGYWDISLSDLGIKPVAEL